MHNYSYDHVTSLLESIGANDVYHGYRLKWLKLNYPNLLNQIYYKTEFLNTASLPERLYCYTNDIIERPKCKMCDNSVTYSKREYHVYCSQRCSILDMKSLIGVENSSQLESVKDKKKKKSLEKYGVDNVSKATDIKMKISKIRSKQWEEFFNELLTDSKKEKSNHLTEKEYNRTVWKISNYMYRKYIDIIDPKRIRSDQYHLDHCVSIKHGYLNLIPAHVIGDITNLMIIPASENTSKSFRNSISINELFIKYNEFYSINEPVNINEILHKKVLFSSLKFYPNESGICTSCGNVANYKFENNQKWCCMPSRNSCPGMRTKNSITQKLSEKKKEATQLRVASNKL